MIQIPNISVPATITQVSSSDWEVELSDGTKQTIMFPNKLSLIAYDSTKKTMYTMQLLSDSDAQNIISDTWQVVGIFYNN